MHRDTAGYWPGRLALIGIGSYPAGLLIPVLNLDPNAGAMLRSLGIWLLVAAYTWYALNIYDLEGVGPKVTAVLMLAIPATISWSGEQFFRTFPVDAIGATVSLSLALALGATFSPLFLWTLAALRHGLFYLLHRHERRRRRPGAARVALCVLVISCCSLPSAILSPLDPLLPGLSPGVYGTSGTTWLSHAPGAPVPAGQGSVVPVASSISRQGLPTPGRTPDTSITQALTAARTATADLDTIERSILSCTNRERQKQGFPALQQDAALAAIARAHSQDMAKNNFFSHTNLRGQDPTARAIAAGYDVRRDLGGGRFSIGTGENIDRMPTGDVAGHGYVDNDSVSIAQAMVLAWMNSPGHRQNILHTRYARIGVGVAYDGTYYIGTQNFI